MSYKPAKRNYFNRTHKEIDEAINSGVSSTIGYFHRSLVNAQRDMRRDDPYGKNEKKIKQYDKKIAKLYKHILENKLYEEDAFYY